MTLAANLVLVSNAAAASLQCIGVDLISLLSSSTGAAYVFYSPDGVSGWSQASLLLASDAAIQDYFGSSVAVWGSIVVVGAYADDNSRGESAGIYLYMCY